MKVSSCVDGIRFWRGLTPSRRRQENNSKYCAPRRVSSHPLLQNPYGENTPDTGRQVL
jgi:hypothetical protein